MNVVWGHFQTAYPRKGCTVMDDDVGKLWQPLMASGSEDESDGSLEGEELGGLLPHRDMRPQFDEGAAIRRKRRRRKDEEDLGEVARGVTVSVEPLKLLRSVGSWMVSLSAAGNLLVPRSSSTLPTSLSTQMLTHRRKQENMDEVVDRALAVVALIAVGFCFLLLLVVYSQAA
ncbi:hypothetical protein GN244_ATG00962 [Phytophthora infestans]|uniref:Transmembrane protein n=1 Tax=Phytophthora infestans TaxID=4787 RepID=A0A833SDN8_PHYIN|nr:hypothetical protein GN244_ATG00962 [Phytophthora infestans]KAF4130185.1 hypothetical protein GN958_ATG20600 [Phytophthora infestans]KAI9996747.1 hypothetical protein PInf_000008 [Phytophthora infestans]KAI9997612.1 hypothetical protein PInf_001540 [Phytophthora infestans]